MSSEATTNNNDRSWLATVAQCALAIAGTALVGMVLVEAWQVFARYVLNNSPSWTEPVALLLMSTTMMLGAAVGVRHEAHFGFYIVMESNPALGKWLRVITRSMVAAIGAVLAIFGARLMTDAWWFDMAGVPLPQGIVYLPMTVGGTLMALFAIERLLRKSHFPSAAE